jgi:proteasome assembly chaperone (PAC2) family protein
LPGFGNVGKIAAYLLLKFCSAKPFAELYSPHFPYFVIVSKKGNVRLLRGTFYYWKNRYEGSDIILFIGDDQPADSKKGGESSASTSPESKEKKS